MNEPAATPKPGDRIYRHSIAARFAHWLWTLAMLVLVMSGLQIFNAAPYLDASDKSDPAHRILAFGAHMGPDNKPVGTTTILGHTFETTNLFGWTDNGMGGKSVRAFPGSLTLPAEQDLADGRIWHFFFGWMLTLAIVVYIVAGAIRKDLRELILRPSDLPKLWPMQAYYFRLRKEPPPHGKYNPLQKATYTVVLFGFIPLIILTGLALSPGVDAFTPLGWLFGGRQFARTWHFVLMSILIAYFCLHMVLVAINGPVNQIRSMITGWYRMRDHDGVGA
jgi:thiosulfate reductase cytochrome b subunit